MDEFRRTSDFCKAPLPLELCGFRVYDIRTGMNFFAMNPAGPTQRVGPLCFCLVFVSAIPFLFISILLWIPSLIESLLLASCGGCGWGKRLRDEAHVTSRRAFLQEFAERHDLLLSHSTVQLELFFTRGLGDTNMWHKNTYVDGGRFIGWRKTTLHLLHVRFRTQNDSPPGLLPGEVV